VKFFLIFLVALPVVGAVIIALQIFLSKKENKWLGLIMPIISLCISLIAVLSIASYTEMTETTVLTQQITDEGGNVIQESTQEMSKITSFPQNTPRLGFTVTSVFLLYNIPTIVLAGIYFGCREKQRQRKALGRMQAQDLE